MNLPLPFPDSERVEEDNTVSTSRFPRDSYQYQIAIDRVYQKFLENPVTYFDSGSATENSTGP